ncbi:MAG: DNA helicase-2/ATP-dependent DNA helicase PcrA [Planctomycetota bacterium]|jgi:DNA helicase-2/ATP-dependent DNA helicase PcrA
MQNDLLDGLNSKQREAVLHIEGPLLVVAGAGTGKTKTLTHRIAHLVSSGIAPHRILAVTFTNKAAAEMRDRMEKLLATIPGFVTGSTYGRPMLKTFHGLGVYLLRQHADRIGIKKHFTILDAQDALGYIKQAMVDEGIDPKEHDPRLIRSIISKAKNNLTTPSELEDSSTHPTTDIAAQVWQRYDTTLRAHHAFDFDDLLIQSYVLLQEHTDIREHYQRLWQYVHVDEYQDTNTIQHKLIELLVRDHHNLCVVGDGDQNIYTWRGATMRNILNFEKDFKGAHVVILSENYRSTKTILSAADSIIEKNKVRIPKELITNNQNGELISLYTAFNEHDEAYWVGKTITELISSKVPPTDIAIVFRTNFQSRILEEACLYYDIPYQVVGTRFFSRAEIKDVLSYLLYALNQTNLAALRRIINTPKRGLGKVAMAQIMAENSAALSPKSKAGYLNFQKTITDIQKTLDTSTPSDIIKYIIHRTGYAVMLGDGTPDEQERLMNLQELVTYATKYDILPEDERLTQMVEDIALISDQDTMKQKETEESVRLMTIHAAKGLEFSHVFIVGLEQGLFPSERTDADRDTEEERRLMYVAVTRAKHKLYLSHAHMRKIYGKSAMQMSSEFLADIPDLLITREGDVGGSFSGGGLLDDPIGTIYI